MKALRSLVASLAAAGAAGRLVFGAASTPARWARGEAIPVWIEDVNVPAQHLDLVRRAVHAWSAAGEGRIAFEETREFPPTGIRVRFVTGDVHFGEAMPYLDGRSGSIVKADVVLSVDAPGDGLQKQLVLYLTALHEIGHALGLAHTERFDSIMYKFQRPLDPDRYFLRYRKVLRSPEDIGSERATGLFPDDRRALLRLYGP